MKKGTDSTTLGRRVMGALKAGPPGANLQQVQFVGPQVSQNLFNKGGLALLYTLIGILIYLIIRFHWKLAAGAVIGLLHDLVITVGVFSVSGMDFDLTVLAAILAVLGYSVNDTVVVFDRIRENFPRMRKATPAEVVNAAINQTLSRTVITSGVTLLAVLALFFLGGQTLHGFAFALIVGILIGTYSSIFVASRLALWLGLTSRDLFPPKEEDAERASRATRQSGQGRRAARGAESSPIEKDEQQPIRATRQAGQGRRTTRGAESSSTEQDAEQPARTGRQSGRRGSRGSRSSRSAR
jgi:preprotein translocase subunit SecF